jgi:hypothetical protein
MTTILLLLPSDSSREGLLDYLNQHLDKIRPAFDLDVSWAYIRAVIDEVRVTRAIPSGNSLRIHYEYDYSAHCSCKNLDARDTYADSLQCEIRDGHIVLKKFVPMERTTADEL